MLYLIESRPESALDAAAAFHSEVLPKVRDALSSSGGDLLLVFATATHEHRAWRLAAVQQMARDYAPNRVNALEADDDAAIKAVSAYLKEAPGMTGQLLKLDGNGAQALLSESQ